MPVQQMFFLEEKMKAEAHNPDRRGRKLTLRASQILREKLAEYREKGLIWTKHRLISEGQKVGLDWRTLERYSTNPEKLDQLVDELLKEKRWAYFFEGMRLFSTPMRDLREYLGKYVPHLNEGLFLVRKSDVMHQRLGSIGTFYNKARECFDAAGPGRTIRDRLNDLELNRTIESNLREWAPGTVGVHTVRITWDLDHGKGNDRKDYNEVGGSMDVMLLGERRLGPDKAVAFSPLQADTTDEEKAENIRAFLADIEAEGKVVRLVTTPCNDGFVPTTIGREPLQRLLGDSARVEEDVPTVGANREFAVSNRTVDAFRVHGRFSSQDEMYAYLHSLMNEDI